MEYTYYEIWYMDPEGNIVWGIGEFNKGITEYEVRELLYNDTDTDIIEITDIIETSDNHGCSWYFADETFNS